MDINKLVENQTRLHYTRDEVLYILWKYLNGERFIGRAFFRPQDFDFVKSSIGFHMLLTTLESLGVEIENFVFHKDIYEKYIVPDVEVLQYEKNDPSANVMKKTVQSFLSGSFTKNDIKTASLFTNKLRLIEFFEFSAVLSPKNKNKIQKLIDLYIDEFINNRLEIEHQNYYQFSLQKEYTQRTLEPYWNKYGNEFIFIGSPGKHYYTFENDTSYLLFHSLISLEKLQYLEIKDVWVYNNETPRTSQTDDYKIKLRVSPQLFRKEEKTKKEEKPINSKKELIFDADTGKLYLQGKEILISRSKDSNAYYLLKTLFKERDKKWSCDEIWEDWKITEKAYSKENWQKLYNAGYAINEKVAKETTIKDFLLVQKTTIFINSKYLS